MTSGRDASLPEVAASVGMRSDVSRNFRFNSEQLPPYIPFEGFQRTTAHSRHKALQSLCGQVCGHLETPDRCEPGSRRTIGRRPSRMLRSAPTYTSCAVHRQQCNHELVIAATACGWLNLSRSGCDHGAKRVSTSSFISQCIAFENKSVEGYRQRPPSRFGSGKFDALARDDLLRQIRFIDSFSIWQAKNAQRTRQ